MNKRKMIGAHPVKRPGPSGLNPKRPQAVDGGIHKGAFIRELLRSADRIINPQGRPRP